MCTKFLKFNLKNKHILSNIVFLTVLLYIVYSFTFILPHNLHCAVSNNREFLSHNINTHNLNIDELNNSDQNSENENKQTEDDDLDDCPICNLSYFNTLNYSKPSTFDCFLQETSEKPVSYILKSLSSYSFLKFFLRSPPTYTA